MRIWRSTFIFILLVVIGFWNELSAQNLNCQVNIQMQHLQPRDQEDLSDLQRQLTNYLNGRNWSNENQDIVIKCNVQITIKTVTSRGAEKIYPSEFLIGSPSGENFYDKAWEFTYVPGQSFEYYRTSFDPLLDLIDFYAYMVIAGEMDTYNLFAGTPFYDQAKNIANQGQLSNYSRGWTSRLEEVLLITDGDHVPLRESKFYYYECLYFVEEKPNPNYVQKLASAVVQRLANVHNKRPNSRALKRFFDAHFQEICKLFQYDRNRENINKLIDINPNHRDTYENCQTRL